MNSKDSSNITLIRITGSIASGKTTIANALEKGLEGDVVRLSPSITLAGLMFILTKCELTQKPFFMIMDECDLRDEELEQVFEKQITIQTAKMDKKE